MTKLQENAQTEAVKSKKFATSSLLRYFKTQALAPERIHAGDIFSNTLRETHEKGYYAEAIRDMEAEPYAVRNRAMYNFARFYSILFHWLSGIVGVLTAAFLSVIVSGLDAFEGLYSLYAWLVAGITFVLLSLLLVGGEVLKARQSGYVFKAMANRQPVSGGAVALLMVAIVVNVLASFIGGMVLGSRASDKTAQLRADYAQVRDSVNAHYKELIIGAEADVTALERARSDRRKRSKLWGLTDEENKVLKGDKERLHNLEQQQASALAELKQEHARATIANLSESKNKGLIAGGILLLLELLAVVAHYYYWIYKAKVKEEAINFGLSPALQVQAEEVAQVPVAPQAVDAEKIAVAVAQAMAEAIKQMQLAPVSVSYPGGGWVQPEKKQIGFAFGQQAAATPTPSPAVNNEAEKNAAANASVSSGQQVAEPKDDTVDHKKAANTGVNGSVATQSATNTGVSTGESAATYNAGVMVGGMMRCEHCGKEVVKKTDTKRFCDAKCRTAWHKAHNGFDIEKHLIVHTNSKERVR